MHVWGARTLLSTVKRSQRSDALILRLDSTLTVLVLIFLTAPVEAGALVLGAEGAGVAGEEAGALEEGDASWLSTANRSLPCTSTKVLWKVSKTTLRASGRTFRVDW